jgi:hypothetical protein
MPTYVILMRFTERGAKTIKESPSSGAGIGFLDASQSICNKCVMTPWYTCD